MFQDFNISNKIILNENRDPLTAKLINLIIFQFFIKLYLLITTFYFLKLIIKKKKDKLDKLEILILQFLFPPTKIIITEMENQNKCHTKTFTLKYKHEM